MLWSTGGKSDKLAGELFTSRGEVHEFEHNRQCKLVSFLKLAFPDSAAENLLIQREQIFDPIL